MLTIAMTSLVLNTLALQGSTAQDGQQSAAATVAAPLARAPSPAEALAQAHALATGDPALCAIYPIGRSWSGQPIEVMVLSGSVVSADDRPAVLLVAGLDGTRPSSVAIAVNAARKLLETPEVLQSTTVYLIPCANPDAFSSSVHSTDGSAQANLHPVDDDRDGTTDEDPPRDINGDGAITMMRRHAPPADDPPTHLKDPADARLMRTADPIKDLRADYTIYIEGVDADGDGSIAEDGIGGVRVDGNFPHRWERFSPSAGTTQLSEPESMAIAQFVISHRRIFAALVVGRWDNLVKTPDSSAKDITGRTPMSLDGADKATWEELGRIWRSLSGQVRAQEADPSGSLALWLYAHRGIPAFATQLWGRPDASPPPAPPEAASPAAAPTAPVQAQDEEALGWLQWSDRDNAGKGFLAWTPFSHPTLGEVELGGFRFGFRTDPPVAQHDRLSGAIAGFTRELIARQPRVALENVAATSLAPGLVQINAEVVNKGWLATSTAMGKTNRAPSPVIVRLSTPKERILAGQRVTKVDALAAAGGRAQFKWIVRADPGERILLEAVWAPRGSVWVSIVGESVSPEEVKP